MEIGSGNSTFFKLAQTVQEISETQERSVKVTLCSDYLSTLNNDADLQLSVQYLCEGAFSKNLGKRISLGNRTIGLLAAEVCEIDYDKVYKPSKNVVGSASETIEKLLLNIPAASEKWATKNLNLSQVAELFERLYEASSRADKQSILRETWIQMHPLEVKYFLRIAGRKSLNIGLKMNDVLSAISTAFGFSFEEVRLAYILTGSAGKTAVLAKNKELQKAQITLFQPVDFIFASSVKLPNVKPFDDFVVEELIDGFRAQLHISEGKVKLFSKDLNDISQVFPEIVAFFKDRNLPPMILDGTICLYKDEIIHPKQMLQERISVKKASHGMQKEYPAIFISYDVLYFRDEGLYELPHFQRRYVLLEASKQFRFPCTIQFSMQNKQELEDLFEQSQFHGNKGLILKRKDSVYEFGQRNTSWLKLKKPGGSLNTILMYAHSGNRNQEMPYSEFTYGISVREDERFEEAFIPIGKTECDFQGEELKKLTTRIKEITAEKYGPTSGLVPEIVVELEFDRIQVNKRTKANYVLRLPKIKEIRWNLTPNDVHTLRDVEKWNEENSGRKRLRQKENSSFTLNL